MIMSELSATETRWVPQRAQKPRCSAGRLEYQAGSPPGPVQVSSSRRNPTHAIAGAPERRVQCSQEHRWGSSGVPVTSYAMAPH